MFIWLSLLSQGIYNDTFGISVKNALDTMKLFEFWDKIFWSKFLCFIFFAFQILKVYFSEFLKKWSYGVVLAQKVDSHSRKLSKTYPDKKHLIHIDFYNNLCYLLPFGRIKINQNRPKPRKLCGSDLMSTNYFYLVLVHVKELILVLWNIWG